jgi:phosphatidate cytidylyltransferase
MAFHLGTFKIRIFTAIVFAVIMLCGVLINYWTFLLLFIIIHFGCWVEYQKISALIEPEYKSISSFHKYGVMIVGFGFMLWMTNDAYLIGSVKLSEIGWYFMLVTLIALPVNEILVSRHFNLKVIFISIAGLLYISLSCGLMIDLRSKGMISGSAFSIDLGLVFPVLLIATIWINDTMAYIVGSSIGKTRLSSISPKKTWEGTIGGALLAIITVTILGNIFFEAAVFQVIIISFLACVTGIIGDLFESKLKRMAGVKDSGHIMPGHGGFLDRFDSLLIATTFVWLYINIFL